MYVTSIFVYVCVHAADFHTSSWHHFSTTTYRNNAMKAESNNISFWFVIGKG